jgi:hypothetical protein
MRLALAVWRYFNQKQPPAKVSWRPRLAVALAIGVVATFFAYHQLTGRALLASDFEYDLRAAHRMLDGLNPYNDPTTHYGLPYPFDAQFPYPLFAAMIAAPFTLFTSYVAGALYVGCLSGIMAFAVTRDGWWRLSIFLSPCYLVTASVANWSPLLVASAFLPVLYPLAIVKPTLIAPVMLNYPNMRGYLLCFVSLAVSLVIFPAWPLEWLASLMSQPGGKYTFPLLMGPSLLILACIFLWKRRPARLLLMLACVPQHPFFYDQLLLWLIPQTLRQSLALSAITWAAYLSWWFWDPDFQPLAVRAAQGPNLYWTAFMFYMPALGLVFWQAWRDRRKSDAEVEADEPSPVQAVAA